MARRNGVNIRDQVDDTALTFASTYGITYPSVIDANDAIDGALQLAFSGTVAPNAVPTALAIDKQGRVASRVLGRLPDASVLEALIETTLAEDSRSPVGEETRQPTMTGPTRFHYMLRAA